MPSAEPWPFTLILARPASPTLNWSCWRPSGASDLFLYWSALSPENAQEPPAGASALSRTRGATPSSTKTHSAQSSVAVGSPSGASAIAGPRPHDQPSLSLLEPLSRSRSREPSERASGSAQAGSTAAAPLQAPAPSHASENVQASPSSHPDPFASNAHPALQQSPPLVFPSSQSSPVVAMPLPQAVSVQFESHPSPSTRLPSSHSSSPSSAPLPHASSSAPRSAAAPETRGVPSMSSVPATPGGRGAAAPIAGDPGPRCRSPAAGFTRRGSANVEFASLPVAACQAANPLYGSPVHAQVEDAAPPLL